MADIFFATPDRSTVYQLPILPENFPELTRTTQNEEFYAIDGQYILPGYRGLYSFTLEGWLPAVNKTYPFAKNRINPYLIINMWAAAMRDKQPLRFIIHRRQDLGIPKEAVNMLVLVESMTHQETRNSDVSYSVDFMQYRELT